MTVLFVMIAGWLFIVIIVNVCRHINGLKLMVEMLLFQRLLSVGMMEFPASRIIITTRQCYRETIHAKPPHRTKQNIKKGGQL